MATWKLICLVCVLNIDIVTLQSVTTDNVNVNRNVGDEVELIFYTDLIPSQYSDAKSFYIELDNIKLSDGVNADYGISSQAPSQLMSRLKVPSANVSENKQTYTLKITNLEMNDTGFYNATLAYTNQHVLKKAAIFLDVKGGPTQCGAAPWPSLKYFMEGASGVTMETRACGNPPPTVIFTIETIIANATYTVTNGYTHQYIYTVTLPTVTTSFCGRNISYELSGHNVNIIRESTKMNVSFMPPKPSLQNAYVEGSCVKSSWLPVDIGICKGIQYEVAHLNADNASLSIQVVAMDILSNSFCNASIVSSISGIQLRSLRGGKFSQWDFIRVNFTQGNWGPYICGTQFPDAINVDGSKSENSFSFDLCGNPKPVLGFTIEGSGVNMNEASVTNGEKHSFTIKFPTISASMCNKTFAYIATANGNQVTGSAILSGNFLPPQVPSVNAFRSSVCTYVSWSSADFGKCTGLIYEVSYVQANGSLTQMKNVSMATRNDTYCINIVITNITHAQVRTWIGSKHSDWTKILISIELVTAELSFDEDDNWPLIIGLIVGLALFLLLLLFLAICWRCCKRKENQRMFQSIRESYHERKLKKEAAKSSSIKQKRSTRNHQSSVYTRDQSRVYARDNNNGTTNSSYEVEHNDVITSRNKSTKKENYDTKYPRHIEISAPIIQTSNPDVVMNNQTKPSPSENISFSNTAQRQSPSTLTSYNAQPTSFVYAYKESDTPKQSRPRITYLYNDKVNKPKVYGMYLPPDHFDMEPENV